MTYCPLTRPIFCWTVLVIGSLVIGPQAIAQEPKATPIPTATSEQIRGVVAQSALSNCYLLRAGVNPKTAFRANTAAAISHLKDTKNEGYNSIPPGNLSRLSRLVSIQIASASTRICPKLIPADVKALVNDVETKLKNRSR